MRKYNINANLARAIKQLYDKAITAVQMNSSTGEWFKTTVGVRQIVMPPTSKKLKGHIGLGLSVRLSVCLSVTFFGS